MSLADLLGRASPVYDYYATDRKILDDYKGAYDTYTAEYDAYKNAYDAHLAKINAYNDAVKSMERGPADHALRTNVARGNLRVRRLLIRVLPARMSTHLLSKRKAERSGVARPWRRHRT
jgi:hypothetical protein